MLTSCRWGDGGRNQHCKPYAHRQSKQVTRTTLRAIALGHHVEPRALVLTVMVHGRILRRKEEVQRMLGWHLRHRHRRRRRLADGDQRRGLGTLCGLGGQSLS